jgi:hypothetical protein
MVGYFCRRTSEFTTLAFLQFSICSLVFSVRLIISSLSGGIGANFTGVWLGISGYIFRETLSLYDYWIVKPHARSATRGRLEFLITSHSLRAIRFQICKSRHPSEGGRKAYFRVSNKNFAELEVEDNLMKGTLDGKKILSFYDLPINVLKALVFYLFIYSFNCL